MLHSLAGGVRAADEVNVYSARKEALIKPLLDQYAEASGVEVNLVTGSGDALLTIINDILDFSKIEADKLKFERIPFSLREMMGDIPEVFIDNYIFTYSP